MRLNVCTKMVLGVACVVIALGAGSAIAHDEELFKGEVAGRTVPPTTPGLERIEVTGKATVLGKFKAVLDQDTNS